MSNFPILVTGATGAQGGAVVDALLDAGMRVRALVRDAESEAAHNLAARGVALVPGDFDDDASLTNAVRDVFGVFSMQLPPRPGDLDSEVRTGRRLIAAARTARVEMFVHTSVARAGDHESFVDWATGRWWPHYWTSKAAVNAAVRAAGFPHWVILKPAFMMDNFALPKAAWMFPGLREGILNSALKPDTRLDLIAAADVGRFAAASFAAPERFDGREIDLAAESLTMTQVAAALAAAATRPVTARSLSGAQARAAGCHAGLVESQQWANVEGYRVDLAAAQAHGLALEAFAPWALRNRNRLPMTGTAAG